MFKLETIACNYKAIKPIKNGLSYKFNVMDLLISSIICILRVYNLIMESGV